MKGECGVADRRDGKQGSLFWFSFPYRPDDTAKKDSLIDIMQLQRPENDNFNNNFNGNINGNNFNNNNENININVNNNFSTNNYVGTSNNTNNMNNNNNTNNNNNNTNINQIIHNNDTIKPKIVLVIDDSVSILKTTSRLLTTNGHTVETAPNGSVGLKILKESYLSQKFDMVLTDLQMPVMDGIESTKRYRDFENEQQLKFELEMQLELELELNLQLELRMKNNLDKNNRINYLNNNDNTKKKDKNNINNINNNENNENLVKKFYELENSTEGYDTDSYQDEENGNENEIGNINLNENNIDNDIENNLNPNLNSNIIRNNNPNSNSNSNQNNINNNAINQVNTTKLIPRKRLLIIGMSANSDNQSREEALNSGMDFFIAKPFSYKDVKAILLSIGS